MSIFVTGTDTNVGKTVISAWICLHTMAKYWKPIQTG
ncbi:MAG: dethiobiotin synthase, partial [Holosporaceae bacterium]|nr:dethiobiotin synthase [Holosporaceae bacterium]